MLETLLPLTPTGIEGNAELSSLVGDEREYEVEL